MFSTRSSLFFSSFSPTFLCYQRDPASFLQKGGLGSEPPSKTFRDRAIAGSHEGNIDCPTMRSRIRATVTILLLGALPGSTQSAPATGRRVSCHYPTLMG
jgi:hypothetical protein